MRKLCLLTGLVCLLLVDAYFVHPARAAITASLENPENGPLSGFAVVSGWAFALVDGSPVDVTVRVRIDGVIQNEIPCCGPRADVNLNFPEAPTRTAFSGQILYSLLPTGPHTIGIEVTADGCEPVLIDRSVKVVRPGGSQFVNSISFDTATVTSAEGAQLSLDPVQVEPTHENKPIVNETWTLEYRQAAQSLAIIDTTASNTARLFTATLNGRQVLPQTVDTPGTGEAQFTLLADNRLTYLVQARGLTSPLTAVPIGGPRLSSAHIQIAKADTTGPLTLFLSPRFPKPNADGDFVWQGTTIAPLTDSELEALFRAELYVNIRTEEYEEGEIRGQIVVAPHNCSAPSRNRFVDACPELNGDIGTCNQAWQLAHSDTLNSEVAVPCASTGTNSCVACDTNDPICVAPCL